MVLQNNNNNNNNSSSNDKVNNNKSNEVNSLVPKGPWFGPSASETKQAKRC